MKLEDMVNILKHYSDSEIYDNGMTLRTKCPIHHSNNPTSFVINKNNGMWYCHSGGCGGGDAIQFIETIEKINFKEAKEKAELILNKKLEEEHIRKEIKEAKKFISNINKEVDEIFDFDLNKYQKVKTYKDFDEQIINKFDLFYAEEIEAYNRKNEKYILKNRLVFPVYQDGSLVFISTRKTKNDNSPKWLHLPRGVKKKHILYNYDEEESNLKELFVVEGITDVWRLYSYGYNAVAIFGSTLSEEQALKLIIKTDTIILCLDGDKAGREGTSVAEKLLKNKVNLFKMTLPENLDPDSISKEEFQILYNEKEKVI